MTSELAQNSDERAERIRELCRHMERHPDEPMRLCDLARRAGLSVFHLQRTFKSIVGVTPKDYLEARRVQLLKRNLRESRNVTDAVYDSGFGSSSRVYERADTRLGMTPHQYREGGRGASISYIAAQTSIGVMMIGATDRGICFLQFGNDAVELAAALRREYPQAAISPSGAPSHPQLQLWIESIRGYLAGERGRLDLPLDIRATAFQMRVWKYLQTIPYGSVESYSEVAAGIGQPAAARAVARACATNGVAIVIPCHRVVRGTGELGGYRWGIERKRALIDTERSAAANGIR
jgi:AraC family transcriptional regulator, regulatory protein of adaptative response / methylated-DNA-[protein]-cysteine methyltransferase